MAVVMIGNVLSLVSNLYVTDVHDRKFAAHNITLPPLSSRHLYPLLTAPDTCSAPERRCSIQVKTRGMFRMYKVLTCYKHPYPKAGSLDAVKRTSTAAADCLLRELYAAEDLPYRDRLTALVEEFQEAVRRSDAKVHIASGSFSEGVDALLSLAYAQSLALHTKLYVSYEALAEGRATDSFWAMHAVGQYDKKPGVYLVEIDLVSESSGSSMRAFADLVFGRLKVERYPSLDAVPALADDVYDSVSGGCSGAVVLRIERGHKFNSVYLSDRQLECLLSV